MWIWVAVGTISGLVMHYVWRIALMIITGHFFPEALRSYNNDLLTDREIPRELLLSLRDTLLFPMAEELIFRGSPICVLFISHDYYLAIPIWICLNGIWIISHIWNIRFRCCCLHPQQRWTTHDSIYLHFIAMFGYALAFTMAWIVAGVEIPPKWPTHSLVIALVEGLAAATIAHGLHNYLIRDTRCPGRVYRRLRMANHYKTD